MKAHRLIFITVLFVLSTTLLVLGESVIKRDFDAKKKIDIKLILGSCTITNSNDGRIHVAVQHTYEDNHFEAIFKERPDGLKIAEEIIGNNHHGSAEWMLEIPKGTEVDFRSATGSLSVSAEVSEFDGDSGTGSIEISESRGEFELNTGTGAIEVRNSEGKFELNSGTGKVSMQDSKGKIEANSGTGKVTARDVTFIDEGEFNSGTGKVEITKPMGDEYELYLNSGTNDAVLDMAGQPLQGYFEMSAKAHAGSIIAPVSFTEEKELGNGDGYTVRKSFTIKKDTPRYYISTGTGNAELKP